jgi:hypothetical protein
MHTTTATTPRAPRPSEYHDEWDPDWVARQFAAIVAANWPEHDQPAALRRLPQAATLTQRRRQPHSHAGTPPKQQRMAYVAPGFPAGPRRRQRAPPPGAHTRDQAQLRRQAKGW